MTKLRWLATIVPIHSGTSVPSIKVSTYTDSKGTRYFDCDKIKCLFQGYSAVRSYNFGERIYAKVVFASATVVNCL